jgi:hypothetical protein
MAIQVKSLTVDPPKLDTALAAQNDPFNVIPVANVVYDLYTATNNPSTQVFKSAIVKSIRLVNTHTGEVKVTLYFNRPNANGQHRRRLLTPQDMSLPANYVYFDDDEITLEPGDKIQGKADVANVIQYLISGVERDVS